MALNGSMGLGFTLTAKDLASSVIKSVGQRLTELKSQGAAGGGAMAGAFKDATVRMRDARGRFLGGAKDAEQSLEGMGTKGAGVLGKLGGLVSSAAIIGGFTSAIGAANEFTTALNGLRAVSGASVAEMKLLKDAAMQAGIATQFDPTEAANALTDLASAGFNAKDSIALLNPTLDLAAASLGQLTPSDAAGLASQGLKAFGLGVDQAGATVDKMVQSMNLFAVRAKDLPLGIAGISRGAGAMKQSLDESLIAFGLVRNVMPRVESAATAVSTAMERMVDSKVQGAIKGLGVSVTDSAGKFRPFLDVVGDMMPALQKMTDAKRAAFLQDTFGAEALGGFNAIMQQVTKGITTQEGQTLKGADAFRYLRDQFASAGGTAAKFRDELLKDLPGQLKLLQGSLKTLLVAVGEPLAQAIAPAVKFVVDGVNTILGWFTRLSDGTKKHMAQVALAIGGLGVAFSLAGGPVTGALAAIMALFAGLKRAYDANVGGIADKFASWGKKIAVVWDAVSQLLSKGFITGGTKKSLEEDTGLANFVGKLAMWVGRIKNFFEGIGKGFDAAMAAAKPAIDVFVSSLEKLGAAMGLTTENDPSESRSKWEAFGSAGAKVGQLLGGALTYVITIVTALIDVGRGLTITWHKITESFSGLAGVGDSLGGALSSITEALGGVNSQGNGTATAFQAIGASIGLVAGYFSGVLVANIRSVITLVESIATTFSGVINIVKGIFTGDWPLVWQGFMQVVLGAVLSVISMIQRVVETIASGVDALTGVFGIELHATDKTRAFFDGAKSSITELLGLANGAKDVMNEAFAPAQKAKEMKESIEHMAELQRQVQADVIAASGTRAPAEGGGAAAAPINVAAPKVSTDTRVSVTLDGNELVAALKKHEERSNVEAGSN